MTFRLPGRAGAARLRPDFFPPTKRATPMTTRDGASYRAWVALTLLVLINLFNYIDRQILAAVESDIENSVFPESEFPRDPVTKQRLDSTIQGKMGSLVSAFMVSYMLVAPIFGLLADRMSRWLLIGV